MSNNGTVKIHGREYKTVALRVQEFRDKNPEWSIQTELVESGDRVVIKAIISNDRGRVIGTGFAEELRGSTQINKTSALENCETSAIGRALAACGFGGSEYASANEVQNAIAQQSEPQHRFKPGEKDKIFNGVIKALEAGDEHGLQEILHEYSTTEEKMKVWSLFNSTQRASIKALLGEQAA